MKVFVALRRWLRFPLPVLLLIIGAVLSACGSNTPVAVPENTAAPVQAPTPTTSTLFLPTLDAEDEPEPEPTSMPGNSTIVISADATGTPIDQRLFGTNVPAWIGPERFTNPQFQQRITTLGDTLLRLPGGSWSNAYNWLACQTGDDSECYWPWAAKPSDFLGLLKNTGQEGMWTVSINGTAQEAAALVAFFNGSVDDDRVIGLDRRGRDWKTVGEWARLRRDAGYAEPYPILLWEVGNEVYGGKAEVGPDCAPWGWEDVWTCDGTAYVNGNFQYDGYLAFREAMRAVDPTILVGAVGVEDPAGWSRWGEKVIAAAGNQLDFYIVHTYAYSETPSDTAAVLGVPQRTWGPIMERINAAFDRHAGGRRVPVALTEYNLVAFQELDTNQLMRRAVNALFMADTIGQMATEGVTMANQWNLANGRANNDTDYGMINADTLDVYPQYYAFLLWERFGTTLLPVDASFDAASELSVYAGRDAAGGVTLLAINKTGAAIDSAIQLSGGQRRWRGTVDVAQADTLQSQSMRFNGVNASIDAASTPLAAFTTRTNFSFAPYSVTLIRLEPAP